MEIETGIANAVLEKMDSLGGVFIPPWLVKDTFVWFALDNIEFLESTPCGMNTLHGTALAVYQSAAPDKLPMISPIYIDRSGRFAGRIQEWCFKLCMACDDDIRNALESLVHIDLSEEEYDQLERFVCQLYKSKVYTKVNEFRWFLYSNRASKGESLPPTIGSLTLHIQRAHYVAVIWRKAGGSHPRLPSPVDCGWEFDTTRHHYDPVRCLNPAAPAAVMNLVKCGCKRGCKRTCSCRNNNLPCTEVCGCVNFSCHNLAKSDDLTLVM